MQIKKEINISLNLFIFIYSLATLLIYNYMFFTRVYDISQSIIFVIGTIFSVTCILMMFCNILFWKHITKPLVIILTITNSLVLYFMSSYNISIDSVMFKNIIETDSAEVQDLLSINMFLYLTFLGILPSILIYKTNIKFKPLFKLLIGKLLNILFLFILVIAVALPNYKNVSQFVRNNRSIKYYIIPVNYFAAIISTIKSEIKQNREFITIGNDAQIKPYWKDSQKKNLFVLVVGETARAKNFSLGGYEKDTNAPLNPYKNDIMYFSDTSSCGTSTTISVPCMFSKFGRKKFKNGSARYTENFLDVLKKAGYDVKWFENNSGCKGNCRRIETIEVCSKVSGCYDQEMVEQFSNKLKTIDNDAFIVLHQLGSHGPTYYKRYPKEFSSYEPSCNTEQLNKCSNEEITNVYDNTIRYSSQVIANTIDELNKVSDKFNTVLIYISDHGESLGERGLYLHGAPYIIAPKEQTQIPFFIWMDNESADNLNIDKSCIKRKLGYPHSHDNLFHTMLSLSGVETLEYNDKLDILNGCKKR